MAEETDPFIVYLTKERDGLLARLAAAELKVRDADRLADEVAVLVRRGVIDARSPAADALLDYRNPPSSERADRLAATEDALRAALVYVRESPCRCMLESATCGACDLAETIAAILSPAPAAPEESEGPR